MPRSKTFKHGLALSKVLFFREGGYRLEGTRFRRWVDAATAEERPITSIHIRPEARKLDARKKQKAWQQAYRARKGQLRGLLGPSFGVFG